MKLRWSEAAASCIDEILEQLRARSGVERARKLADAIVSHISHLESNPQMGRMVPEFQRPDVRELITEKHRVVYLVTVDEIVVLRVVRPRQQLPRLLLPLVDD